MAVDPVSPPPEPSVEADSDALRLDRILPSQDGAASDDGGGSVAAVVEPNFLEEVIWGPPTFEFPVAVEFAADGRVFVAEKGGIIKVFSSLTDETASTYADLTARVHDYWDRGLLGMTLDPDFTTNGRMYVSYAYSTLYGDSCPNPPGGNTDGCVAYGRVSALTNGGSEQTLIEGEWCQQFPSHSMSDIVLDAEGALILGGGDGASFNATPDIGQFGGSAGSPTPKNPCGDPPGGVGGSMTFPSAEGGALRSQDRLTTSDPLGLSGTIIRIDPDTGLAMPDNPVTSGSENLQRIIATGLRNPFRMAVHPVSGELWIGDVGWNTWEEINRHTDPDGAVRNFGWPCREGNAVQSGYDPATMCQNLTGATSPHFVYSHTAETVPGDDCPLDGSSVSAMAFYAGGPYPDEYDNALFFGDYSRQCIWVMPAGTGGLPDPSEVRLFAHATYPVNLTVGPGGDLFYVGAGGSVRRIRYLASNNAPNADAEATPTTGAAPLTVSFDASGSTDPDDDPLTYAWDFGDNDGAFNDAVGVAPSHVYSTTGTFTARVRASDGRGGTDTDSVQVSVGNEAPVAVIDAPSTSLRWSVGQAIHFEGRGLDGDVAGGELPASSMSWRLIMAHCPSSCHEHQIQTFNEVAEGTFSAPDHEYPSHLILRLTVDDGVGGIDTVDRVLLPKTVTLSLRTDPAGLRLTAGALTKVTPFSVTTIAGSPITLNAPTQVVDGFTYTFASWSNGGAKSKTVAPTSSTTYTATFNGGFDDVPPGTKFASDIAWLWNEGITAGCAPDLFCPNGLVTRAQMATFLGRALDLPATSRDFFTDDEGSVHEDRINRLAAAGITAGCSPTRFCPSGLVTRAQMATFLGRAFNLPATSSDFFTDDEGNPHEARINALAAAGITHGCGPTTFCPTGLVTRGQMAAFLHRAIE